MIDTLVIATPISLMVIWDLFKSRRKRRRIFDWAEDGE